MPLQELSISLVASTHHNKMVSLSANIDICSMWQSLAYSSWVAQTFWGVAILASAYLINRTPTPLLHGKTLYEKLFHQNPNYSHLRVFGCLLFVSTHPHTQKPSKFDPRATRIFLGYPYGQKGYRVLDLILKKVFVSRDVTFFEETFLFQNHPDSVAS